MPNIYGGVNEDQFASANGWDRSQTSVYGYSPDGRAILYNPGTQEMSDMYWYAPDGYTVPGSNSGGGGYSGYSGGGGGGGGTAPASKFSLDIDIPEIEKNPYKQPNALPKNATDQQKADYYGKQKQYLQGGAGEAVSTYNRAKAELAKLEAELGAPGYKMTEADAQALANKRQEVANLENAATIAQDKADKINVSVGVSESKDGDKNSVTKTYTITDENGNTVTTSYSEDNGGMTAAELRNKQQQDQQKALNASNSATAAAAAKEVETIQAGAEKQYAIGAAKTALDAYTGQYNQNLDKINKDYAGDQLQGNQDLLMASNETFNQAVKNDREAQQILGQYNLGGSSLGGRLANIAAEAANNSNQIAALTYNQRMQEADSNYGDARLTLEGDKAKQQNAYNQSVAQAAADYYSRLAQQAGKNAADLSQYGNSLYWQGTQFDADGNRLSGTPDAVDKNAASLGGYGNSTWQVGGGKAGSGTTQGSSGIYMGGGSLGGANEDPYNNAAMKDYANTQTNYYKNLQDQYAKEQQNLAKQQSQVKADVYVSDYVAPAAKTYETGLREYKPVNTNNTVLGTAKPSDDYGLKEL